MMTEYEWLTCEDYHAMISHAPVLVSDVKGFGKTVRFSFANDDYVYHCDSSISICDLIREVVGNPFRPIYHVKDYLSDPHAHYHVQESAKIATSDKTLLRKELDRRVFLPEWLTGDVYYFAANIVESGDYRDVDVLADLLEEVGCDNEDLIRHFRQEVMCHYCKAKGKYWKKTHDGSGPFPFQCVICKTTGWLPKPVPCQSGCWALRLITGG